MTVILAIAAALVAGVAWVIATRASAFWAIVAPVVLLTVSIAMFFAPPSTPPSDVSRVLAGAFAGVAVAFLVSSVRDLLKLRARRARPDSVAAHGGDDAPLNR